MSDPSKPTSPSDPQQPGTAGQTGQQAQPPTPAQDPSQTTGQQQGSQQAPQQQSDTEDEALIAFLVKEHGHTPQSAHREVKSNREGVKHKKRQHEQQHGSSGRGR